MKDFEKFDLNKKTETVATDNTLPATPELIKAFDEMEAKAILLKVVPKNCYWEDMDNLTNTPIHYVLKAMNAYAQQSREQERQKVIQECIDMIGKVCPSAIYEWVRREVLPELEKLKNNP